MVVTLHNREEKHSIVITSVCWITYYNQCLLDYLQELVFVVEETQFETRLYSVL